MLVEAAVDKDHGDHHDAKLLEEDLQKRAPRVIQHPTYE
jgi:hypothetical protein